MKPVIKFAGLFLLTVIAFVFCKKEQEAPRIEKRAPIAKAGADTTIILPSCTHNSGVLELDGSASYDPDSNAVLYHWTYISGPMSLVLSNAQSVKATVRNLLPGDYIFELFVRDTDGLASRDSIIISVKVTPAELDIPFNSVFSFLDNYYDPWGYSYSSPNYDYFELEGFGNFTLFGEFKVLVIEYSDTSTLSNVHETFISIYKFGSDYPVASGKCTVNFKQVVSKGGGAFAGDLEITGGSAWTCGSNVPGNHPPLALTGSLNIAGKTATLRITGKIFL
jgi:hypothetical protein